MYVCTYMYVFFFKYTELTNIYIRNYQHAIFYNIMQNASQVKNAITLLPQCNVMYNVKYTYMEYINFVKMSEYVNQT